MQTGNEWKMDLRKNIFCEITGSQWAQKAYGFLSNVKILGD